MLSDTSDALCSITGELCTTSSTLCVTYGKMFYILHMCKMYSKVSNFARYGHVLFQEPLAAVKVMKFTILSDPSLININKYKL